MSCYWPKNKPGWITTVVGAGVGAAAVLAVTVLPAHMPSTLPPIPEIPQNVPEVPEDIPEVPTMPPEFGELSMVDIPPLPSMSSNDESFGNIRF